DLPPWRDREDHALLRESRHRPRPCGAGPQCKQDRTGWHHHIVSAEDVARTVVATVSRAADLPRLRLGAGAGTRASAVGGTAIGDFGSRGLGRPHGHHREDRRGGGVGHARTGRCNRALERDAGIVRAPAGYCRVRGGGRAGERIRRSCSGLMNRFAELLDRLAYEPGRNNKLRLMINHFRNTPDPERGWALAALTGSLTFQHAKPSLIRALIAER